MVINNIIDLVNKLSDNNCDPINIISLYKSNEWTKYIPKNLDNTYKKVLVYTNNLFEIFFIYWSPNSKTLVHDHPNEGCIMKVLQGELIEEQYCNNNNKLTYYKTNIINNISQINGNKIVHRIINKNNYSVTMHIYFPPNYKHNIYNFFIN